MEPGIYIVLAIIVLLIIIVISNIKIVPQAYVFVVERLGAFHAAWGTGLHVKVPFIDRVAKRVSRHCCVLPDNKRNAVHIRR